MGNFFQENQLSTHFIFLYTLCPRSLDPFYVVNCNINWVKTYWTYSIILIQGCRLVVIGKNSKNSNRLIKEIMIHRDAKQFAFYGIQGFDRKD